MTAEYSTFTSHEARLWTGLARAREPLAAQWADLAFQGYPLGAAGLARTGGSPFDNPVGERTHSAATAFSAFITSPDPGQESEQAVDSAIEELVRMRAIQPLPPRQALGMFPAMKILLRNEISKIFRQNDGSVDKDALSENGTGIPADLLPTLWGLEVRIDGVSLLAFDCYCACRERLARMKLEEQQRSYSQILRLANRKAGDEEPGAGSGS